ncbi:MAG: hypothetical protein VB137_16175 [Burkholderia sp.]
MPIVFGWVVAGHQLGAAARAACRRRPEAGKARGHGAATPPRTGPSGPPRPS